MVQLQLNPLFPKKLLKLPNPSLKNPNSKNRKRKRKLKRLS